MPSCLLVGTSPKRPGEPVDTSSNKERRTSRDPDETSSDVSLADFGIYSWGDKQIRMHVNLGVVNTPLRFRRWGGRVLDAPMRLLRGRISVMCASKGNRAVNWIRTRPMQPTGEWALSPSPYMRMERRMWIRARFG